MPSYIFGKIDIYEELLKKDLEVHDTFPKIPEEYDEFSSGFWMNCTLWNHTEDETEKAQQVNQFLIEHRYSGERFSFSDWRELNPNQLQTK